MTDPIEFDVTDFAVGVCGPPYRCVDGEGMEVIFFPASALELVTFKGESKELDGLHVRLIGDKGGIYSRMNRSEALTFASCLTAAAMEIPEEPSNERLGFRQKR